MTKSIVNCTVTDGVITAWQDVLEVENDPEATQTAPQGTTSPITDTIKALIEEVWEGITFTFPNGTLVPVGETSGDLHVRIGDEHKDDFFLEYYVPAYDQKFYAGAA